MPQLRQVVLLILFTALAVPSRAGTVNLLTGNETVNAVGIAPTVAGLGQARISYGKCAFDGVNTVCTLTGNFTGLATGGAYRLVTTYAGNGPSPIIWTASAPGSPLGSHSIVGLNIVLHLTLNDGSTVDLLRAPFAFTFSNATCAPISSPCGMGSISQNPGATIEGVGTASAVLTPGFRPAQGVIGAGAFGAFPTAAPGSWIELYGINFAARVPGRSWAGADFNGVNAPTTLDGTRVTVGGQPAFLSYISPAQLNVQIPFTVAAGPQPVIVHTIAGGETAPYNITINRLQPGLLTTPDFLINGTQYAAALFPDAATFVLPPGAIPGVPSRRARPGDFIVLYGIGFGPVTPDNPAGRIVQAANDLASPLQITIGGARAQVTYSGLAPNYVGLYQINIVIPQVPPGDAVPLTYTLGEATNTQTLHLAIGI